MSWLNMFGNGGKRQNGVHSDRVRSSRRRRMSLESLESRQLLSVNPIANMDVYSCSTEASNVGLSVAAQYGVLSNDEASNGGTLEINVDKSGGVTLNGGGVLVGEDGSFEYSPADGFVGFDSFTYVVEEWSDGVLLGSSIGTAVINVESNVSDPVAITDVYAWSQDTKSHVNADAGVLTNDLSPAGLRLWVSSEYVQDPSGEGIDTAHGTVWFDADPTSTDGVGTGGFWYEPDTGFTGVDTFRYTATDMYGNVSNEGIVAIVVSGDGATITSDYYTAQESVTLEVTDARYGVLANDSLSSGVSVTAGPVTGGTTENGGTYTLSSDGTFTYTPASGFTGTDVIPYEVYNGETGTRVGSGQAVITVVAKVVIPPEANSDIYTMSVTENSLSVAAQYGVLSNDEASSGGTLKVNAGESGGVTLNGGSVLVGEDGSFEYSPAAGFVGFDSFTYVVEEWSDGVLLGSSIGTAVISVESDASNPVAITDVYAWSQDTKSHVDAESGVLANDLSPAGLSLWVSSEYVRDPNGEGIRTEHGTVWFDAAPTSTDGVGTGGFWYEPDAGFTGVDTFRYTATDMYGNVSNEGIVAIAVSGDGVTINPDYYTAQESVTLAVTDAKYGLLANDSLSSGASLTAGEVVNGTTVNGGTYTIASDGTFTYTPASEFTGTDVIPYEVYNGETGAYVGVGQAIVTVVAEVVIPPEANSDIYTMSVTEN
ncbi:MAG: Ig-like domain-containing protein, partial [Planctomycetia bacterium]|nr:Ig-like domain-containing protein [Planctomycetia bacterium]